MYPIWQECFTFHNFVADCKPSFRFTSDTTSTSLPLGSVMLKALCVGIQKWDGEKASHHVTSIGQNNKPQRQQLFAVCFHKVCTFMSQQKSWRKVLGWLSSTSIIGIFSSNVTRSFSSSVNKREARYTPLTEKMREEFFGLVPVHCTLHNKEASQPPLSWQLLISTHHLPSKPTKSWPRHPESTCPFFLTSNESQDMCKSWGAFFHPYQRRIECLIIYGYRKRGLSVARLPLEVYR